MKSLEQIAAAAHRAFWKKAADHATGPQAIEYEARADESMTEEVKQSWIAAVQQIQVELATVQ